MATILLTDGSVQFLTKLVKREYAFITPQHTVAIINVANPNGYSPLSNAIKYKKSTTNVNMAINGGRKLSAALGAIESSDGFVTEFATATVFDTVGCGGVKSLFAELATIADTLATYDFVCISVAQTAEGVINHMWRTDTNTQMVKAIGAIVDCGADVNQAWAVYKGLDDTKGATQGAPKTVLPVDKTVLVNSQKASVVTENALADEQKASVVTENALADAQKALIKDKNALADAQKALVKDKNDLADAQKTLANEQKALTKDQNALADAQKALVKDKKDLADAQKTLANEQKALADAQKALIKDQNALADAQKALVKGKKDLADAQKTLANAQKALTKDQNALADAQKALVKDKKDLADAQKTLANEQKALTDAQKALLKDQNALADAQKALIKDKKDLTKEQSTLVKDASLLVESAVVAQRKPRVKRPKNTTVADTTILAGDTVNDTDSLAPTPPSVVAVATTDNSQAPAPTPVETIVDVLDTSEVSSIADIFSGNQVTDVGNGQEPHTPANPFVAMFNTNEVHSTDLASLFGSNEVTSEKKERDPFDFS